MKTKYLLLVLVSAFSLLPAVPVKGQVYPPPTVLPAFTNGDFETGDFTGWTLSGDTDAPRVVINSGQYGTEYQAHSGTNVALLATWGDPTYLSQTLTNRPGYDYCLSISFWVNNFFGDPDASLWMSFNGSTLYGPATTTNGWVNIQTNIEFHVAGSGATVFQFGFNDDWNGFALDDIRLQWTDVPVHGWFSYTTNNDGTLNITGCNGCGGTLIIPGWINLTPVTSIGSDAFQNYSSLTSVTMGTNVTSIGHNAFQNCNSLTNVTIGTNVTTIGDYAFDLCPSLKSIIIPNKVTSIGVAEFNGCISLTSVTIPNSVTHIGDYAFSSCSSLMIVTNPISVTSIGNYAFAYCTSLTGVYCQGNAPQPNNDSSVFSGDSNAKVYCMPGTTGWGTPGVTPYDGRPTALWTVPNWGYVNNNGAITITSYNSSGGAFTIPITINGLPVTGIDDGAFENCTGLTSINISASITNIGPGTFTGCTSLTAITVDASNPAYSSVGGVLFNKSQTTLIEYPGGNSGGYTIPDGVTNIARLAFEICTGLTSVTIPASVVSIGDYAFYGCTGLTMINFLGNAPSLGSNVFNTGSGYDPATIYYWQEPQWAFTTFGGLPMVLLGSTNNTTIATGNHYAYGANIGWVDWRGDTNHGAVIGTNICSGYIYSANFGWINLGSGFPANGSQYQNNSASDFGVNVDVSGNLNGYAYGANIGWINFEANGAPKVDLASGNLSGWVWSANWGWISLSNTVAYVQTAAIQQGQPTKPQLTSISVNGPTLTLNAVNCTASGQYVLLGTTNVALPLSQWIPILTNQFDSSGSLNLCTNIINPAAQQEFYILKQ